MRSVYVANVDQGFLTNSDDHQITNDELPLDPLSGWPSAEYENPLLSLYDESVLPPSANWEPDQPKGKPLQLNSDDLPLDPNGGW